MNVFDKLFFFSYVRNKDQWSLSVSNAAQLKLDIWTPTVFEQFDITDDYQSYKATFNKFWTSEEENVSAGKNLACDIKFSNESSDK